MIGYSGYLYFIVVIYYFRSSDIIVRLKPDIHQNRDTKRVYNKIKFLKRKQKNNNGIEGGDSRFESEEHEKKYVRNFFFYKKIHFLICHVY